MQRKFLTNLALLLFLNLLVKPFWILGIDRGVQNAVGSEDYGFYFSIFNFAFLFNMLLDLGITNFNNRNIAQHTHLLQKHFSSIVIMKFMLAVVYTVFIFLMAWVIGYSREQMYILAWVGFNNFLLSFLMYLRSNISGLLMFRTDSILSVLDRVLMIVICGVLLWGQVTGQSFRIEWFVYAQTAAYVLTVAIATTIVVRKAAFRRLKWNRPFFIMIVKQSFPFAVLGLLMSVYNKIDSVFIERLLQGERGYRQVGIFAMGFRLLDAANQFALLFGALLLPIFARMIKMKQKLKSMVKMPFSILFTFGVIAALGSYFYRHEIMELLYSAQPGETAVEFGARTRQAADVFGILMFGFLGTSMMYVFSTLLTANGNLRELNIIAGLGIAVNFSLNIILIPRIEATGAAIASLSTQLFTGIAYLLMVQYIFRFSLSYSFLARLIAFVAGVLVFSVAAREMITDWMAGLMLMVVVSFFLAALLKLLDLKSFITIVKDRNST